MLVSGYLEEAGRGIRCPRKASEAVCKEPHTFIILLRTVPGRRMLKLGGVLG